MNKLRQFFKGFKKGTASFGETINTIVNSVLLSIVYFIGVGVTSIFAKLVGKRFLDLKITRQKDTYWSDLDLKKKSIDKYYQQF